MANYTTGKTLFIEVYDKLTCDWESKDMYEDICSAMRELAPTSHNTTMEGKHSIRYIGSYHNIGLVIIDITRSGFPNEWVEVHASQMSMATLDSLAKSPYIDLIVKSHRGLHRLLRSDHRSPMQQPRLFPTGKCI